MSEKPAGLVGSIFKELDGFEVVHHNERVDCGVQRYPLIRTN